MNPIKRFFLLLPVFLGNMFHRPKPLDPRPQFCNVGEGTHEDGIKSYLPTAVTTSRYLLYEMTAQPDTVIIAAGVNEPLGVSDDMVDTGQTDMPIAIKLLGSTVGTTRMISDGTVTNNSRVCASKANPGQVTVPGVGAGTFWVVGKALVPSDANITAGEAVEVIPFQPTQNTY